MDTSSTPGSLTMAVAVVLAVVVVLVLLWGQIRFGFLIFNLKLNFTNHIVSCGMWMWKMQSGSIYVLFF